LARRAALSLIMFLTLLQIVSTAAVAVIVGGVSFSLGQVLVRGMVEPGLELKKTIGQISRDLDFYGNKIFDSSFRDEFNRTFRGHWARLNEHLYSISYYRFFALVFGLPPWKDVRQASSYLLGHSNAPAKPEPEWWRDRTGEIKRLLRIKPESAE
jgi:hypothetical protein